MLYIIYLSPDNILQLYTSLMHNLRKGHRWQWVMIDLKKIFRESSDEEEQGQGLVEYALILFLVAVAVIAILTLLGPQIGSVFSAITAGLS